jgi:hypothetical protein
MYLVSLRLVLVSLWPESGDINATGCGDQFRRASRDKFNHLGSEGFTYPTPKILELLNAPLPHWYGKQSSKAKAVSILNWGCGFLIRRIS